MSQEAIETLNRALARVPGIDKRIVTRQPEEKMQQGKERLRLMAADVRTAREMLGGPTEPTEPIVPEGGDGEYFGGPIGNYGHKVIEGKEFGEIKFEQFENTDLVNCKFTKSIGGPSTRCPKGVRLLNCQFLGLKPADEGHGSHCIYFNNGHPENRVKLILDSCEWHDCVAVNFAETKLSEDYWFNCIQGDTCKIPQTIRQRHGTMLVVDNCEGFKEISARGWNQYINNCPGATAVFWSGNLPARYSEWKDLHKAGGGNNMQCSEWCYANGVGTVKLGHYVGKHDQYPAKNCVLGPNIGKLIEKNHVGTKRMEMKSYKELWKAVGITDAAK